MIHKSIIVFIAFVTMTMGHIAVANDNNTVNAFVDDMPVQFVEKDGDIMISADKNSGNLYTLSREKPDIMSGNNQIQMWVE